MSSFYTAPADEGANAIGHVHSGTVYVRYVTKRDDWVMANLAGDGSPQLPWACSGPSTRGPA